MVKNHILISQYINKALFIYTSVPNIKENYIPKEIYEYAL